MERHLEENTQQHLALMCSLVSRQQHQISSLKSALSRLSLNTSGTFFNDLIISDKEKRTIRLK